MVVHGLAAFRVVVVVVVVGSVFFLLLTFAIVI